MTAVLPLKITKMSGAGNTFALVDARSISAWKSAEQILNMPRSHFAKMICDRVLGLSTDGLLLIEDGGEGFDFNWDFYNSDGSSAEMCGNAARCAARFCHEDLKSNISNMRFHTGAGLVTAQILGDGRVRVKMPAAQWIQESLQLKTNSSSEAFAQVNTGVPHLVQKIHNIRDAVALKDMARECRSHPDLMPAGSNVTFYAPDQDGKIRAVTFERGVEDYTLACGTGAVAAAMVHAKESGRHHIEVHMPGGLLEIQFIEGDSCPLMLGEALFVGEFQYNLEVVR